MMNPSVPVRAFALSLRRSPCRPMFLPAWLALSLVFVLALHRPLAAQGYTWDNVRIGGGGYVTGIVIHPQNKDLWYARTDVGGVYRYDATQQKMVQLINFPKAEQRNWYGGYGVDVHPTDQNIVYVALGMYALQNPAGDVFKSVDKGETWTRLNLNKRMQSNDNEWGYKIGRALVVNPHNPNHVYCGTVNQGLFRYDESTGVWAEILPIASGKVQDIVFDPSNSSRVYLAVSETATGTNPQLGIYRSTDGGDTFQIMSGTDMPKRANRLALSSDGSKLFVATQKKGLKRLDSPWLTTSTTWVNITPSTEAADSTWRALAAHPSSADTLYAVPTLGSMKVYISTNGGTSWQSPRPTNAFDSTVPWHASNYPGNTVSDLVLSKSHPSVAMFGDFFSLYRTADVNQSTISWSNEVALGHEELCALSLASGPVGSEAFLFSGHLDVSGFRHTSLNAYPQGQFGDARRKEVTGIAVAPSLPSRVYIVGARAWDGIAGSFSYSADNGKTLVFSTGYPEAWGWGRVAVSSVYPDKVVVVTKENDVVFSHDGGLTFTAAQGDPENVINGSALKWMHPLAADGAQGDIFYLYNSGNATFHRSTNGGQLWSQVAVPTTDISRTIPSPDPGNYIGSRQTLVSVPGRSGHLWLTRSTNGLARSTNGGDSWTQVSGVQAADMLAVGKAQVTNGYPTLYLWGRANGDSSHSIYRSTNEGGTWLRINDDAIAIGNAPEAMAADQQTFGQIYIGTNGHGIIYGAPAGANGLIIVNSAALPNAGQGVAYLPVQLEAPGASGTTTWVLESGTLPSGLALSSNGVISGTSVALGTASFTVRVTDTAFQSGSKAFTLTTVPASNVGPFVAQDVGSPGLVGSTSVSNGTYTLNGAGANIWTGTDAFHFLYQAWEGDVTLIANVTGISNTHTNAKAGLMIRNSLAANSAHATIDIAPSAGNFGAEFIRRLTDGAATTGQNIASGVTAPEWLKLVRSGDDFTAFYSSNGTTWTQLGGTVSIPMSTGSVYVGLVVCSHNSGQLATGTFTNVSVSGNEAPIVALTAPTDGAIYVTGATVTLTATATDADTIASVDFYLDDETLLASDVLSPFTQSWVPAAGTYTVFSTATDGRGTVGYSLPATITVSENIVPNIATASLPNGVNGTPYSITLASTQANGALTWSLASGALPAGLSLSSSGVISGTPTANGTANFTVRVADADTNTGSADEDTQALTLFISANSVPVIATTTLPGTVTGAEYNQTLAATGGDISRTWSVASGTLPAGLTLSSAGHITGTSTTAGTANFTVRVADGDAITGAADEDTQALSIVVTANSVPAITTASLPNGTSWTAYSNQTLAATGGNGTRVWNVATGTLPPGLSLSSAGVLSGTPTAAGSYYFTVRVIDSDDHTGAGDQDTQDFIVSVNGVSGAATVGAFTSEDIGSPGLTGAANLSAAGIYTVKGGGADIYSSADQFRFLHQSRNGDVRLIARIDSLQETDPKAKAGLMIRDTTASGSRNVNLVLTANAAHGVQLLHRGTANGSSLVDDTVPGPTAPYWLKLERHGNTFTGWESPDGELWFLTGATTFTMNSTGTRVGLAVTAHNNALITTATFSNVSVTDVPAWTAADIGSTGAAGSSSVNYSTDLYTLLGAGANIYSGTDAFHFYYQPWTTGDATLIAEVVSVQNTHQYAKAGLMIRQNLTATSAHATIDLTPGPAVEFLRRTSNGATVTDNTLVSVPAGARFLKLVRTGNQFTAYHSPDGAIWTQLGSPVAITMTGTVYVGLVSCSHVSATTSTGTFSSVFFR